MQWDLGLQGLAVLAGMSVVFGAFTQLVFIGRGPWWVGVAAAAGSFAIGLFVSEAWFGWATEAELQPNIDGLSFDEVLITYLILGVVVLVTRFVMRDRAHEPMPS